MKSYMVIPVEKMSVSKLLVAYKRIRDAHAEAGLAIRNGEAVLVNAAFNNTEVANVEFLDAIDDAGIEIIELVPYEDGLTFEWLYF